MALVVAAGAAAPIAQSAQADTGDGCGNGGAVVVAGTMAPRNSQGIPTGGVTGVADRYARQGYDVQYVDYPTELAPLGSIPYDQDVAIGKVATERAVAGYQARCPGKPVVIAGYSQGARIAGDVLSEAGTDKATPVKVNGKYRKVSARGLSGELYSDPRRDPTPTSNGGIETVLFGLAPGTTMSGARPGGFGAVPVTQYCLQGDPICDLPAPWYYPLGAVDGFVGYFTKHGYYPARMNQPVDNRAAWDCETGGGTGSVEDCVVPAQPATAELAQAQVNPALARVGLPGLPEIIVDDPLNPRGPLLSFGDQGDQGGLLGRPGVPSVTPIVTPSVTPTVTPLDTTTGAPSDGTAITPADPQLGDPASLTPSLSPDLDIADPVPPAGDTEPALANVTVDVKLNLPSQVIDNGAKLVSTASEAVEAARRPAVEAGAATADDGTAAVGS
ncbi:MAG: PE-PPE domain-containing protein [Gordonia sp. (in: high G+C Gram-positive bacteria)]